MSHYRTKRYTRRHWIEKLEPWLKVMDRLLGLALAILKIVVLIFWA